MKFKASAAPRTFSFTCVQSQEQPITTYSNRFHCRYAYGRAAETMLQKENGQDFVAFQVTGNVCSFVICDGVGMSFQGDFAARFLGRHLLKWLNETKAWNAAAFERHLQALTLPASQQLDQLPLPAKTPDLLREVLTDKQRLGSQSMYVCGRIELPTEDRREQGRLWIAWQGDVRLRVWRNEQELSHSFASRMHTAERWSTRTGVIGGGPHVHQMRLEPDQAMRLMLYTDGLADLDAITEVVPSEQIQLLMDAPHTSGLLDDAAFLEMKW